MTDDAGRGRMPVMHVVGGILVGPDDVRDELWVVDGTISFTPPARPGADVSTVRGWVLPGLVDAHCHIGLDAHGATDDATVEVQATTDRDAGALLLRDAGSAADTRWVDDREDLPRLVRAGRHVARPRRYIRNFGVEVEPGQLVDTVVDQAGRGDGWVKLVGDWIDRSAGDLTPCWPAADAAAAIEAAHAAGARVTAHCFGESSLVDLATAGIDCVEHATGLTSDTISLFAERGVAIVPTLVNILTFERIAASAEDKYPIYAKHMRALHARRYETVRDAYDAGLAIYVGTDAGGSIPHGLVAAEVAELVTAGLPPSAALASAAWSARAWLGFPGLTEGASADFVVYDTDPRADVAVLGHPSLVVLRGRVQPTG